MNKVLVLFSLFFFSFIYSQQKVRIGVLTGANYYSLRGSEVLDNVESGFGYSIGLSFEYKISKKISLSTDLILEKKRVDYFYEFDYSYMNPDGSSEEYVHYDALTKNNFNFITLPITLKYIIGDKNPYFIKGGFFLAKMLSQKEKTKISPTLINYNNIHSENFPMASSVDNQDYGFTFGIGKIIGISVG